METITPVLRLGFVGGGCNSAVGYTHFLASRLDGRFDVVAGCFSRNPDINIESARRFGVDPARCYATAEELFDAETLDAICVLTPTPDHKSTVIAALRSGFDVICEKAIATSVSEVQEIAAAQEEAGRRVVVTFNYIGYPMVREARAMIRAGAIGTLRQVYCEMPQDSFVRLSASPQRWRRQDYEVPCVSLDLGVHVVHLVDYLMSGAACSVIAAAENSFGDFPEVVDTVNVLASAAPDTLVSMMWGKAALGNSNGLKFRVFGDEGSLEWEQLSPETMKHVTKDGQVKRLERGQEGLFEVNEDRYNRFKAGHPAGFVEAFANIYEDFFELLIGDASPASPYDTRVASGGIELLQTIHNLSKKL